MPQKIPQPKTYEYISPAASAFGGVIKAPHGLLFAEEYRYWDKERDEADRLGHSTARSIAQMLQTELISSAQGRLALQAMVENKLTVDPPFMAEWQRRAAAVVGMSRLLRKTLFQPGTDVAKTLAISLDNADICLNIQPESPENNRLLLTGKSAQNLMSIAPKPNSTSWYEYDDVYAKAENPASASPVFRQNFAEFFSRPFEDTVFTSFAPFIKQEVWLAEY